MFWKMKRKLKCTFLYLFLILQIPLISLVSELVGTLKHSPVYTPANNNVALIFYGSPRSLQWTIESIRRQILYPLKRNTFHFDIYLHSYIHHETYSNRRSKESNAKLNNTEWKLLQPTDHKLENISDVEKKFGESPAFSCFLGDRDLWGGCFPRPSFAFAGRPRLAQIICTTFGWW